MKYFPDRGNKAVNVDKFLRRAAQMRVLVTGGAGFIGSHMVAIDFSRGFSGPRPDSLDPKVHPSGRPKYLPANIEFIHGDVTDGDTLLRPALCDIDVVFHQLHTKILMPDFLALFACEWCRHVADLRTYCTTTARRKKDYRRVLSGCLW